MQSNSEFVRLFLLGTLLKLQNSLFAVVHLGWCQNWCQGTYKDDLQPPAFHLALLLDALLKLQKMWDRVLGAIDEKWHKASRISKSVPGVNVA